MLIHPTKFAIQKHGLPSRKRVINVVSSDDDPKTRVTFAAGGAVDWKTV